MAIEIVIESPAEISLPVEVRGLNKQVIDALTVTWRTPDDESVEAAESLVYEINDYSSHSGTVTRQAWVGIRDRVKALVREHLISTDKVGWAVDDADKLLRHNHYLFALFYSLCAAKRAAIEKNALKPGESGQPDALPAAQAMEFPV